MVRRFLIIFLSSIIILTVAEDRGVRVDAFLSSGCERYDPNRKINMCTFGAHSLGESA
jgi:hypothetical protein